MIYKSTASPSWVVCPGCDYVLRGEYVKGSGKAELTCHTYNCEFKDRTFELELPVVELKLK